MHNRNSQIYNKLRNYVATPAQLQSHGYPINFHNGSVYIEPCNAFGTQNSESPTSTNSNEIKVRTCCRCDAKYFVDSNGDYLARKSCIYHWGKLRGGDTYYTCCNDSPMSKGCAQAVGHVSLGLKSGCFDGFVKAERANGQFGVYALDCEMCYTTNGLDLAKISLVGLDGWVVYDELVRPYHPIIDFNTRFSGVTRERMDCATKTLDDVRDDLLGFIDEETILVGHGLENDLRALGLAHENVVDTAIVYPHRLGLPYRRSLKQLMKCVCRVDIQAERHDSIEDAWACMKLMLRKIK